MIRAVPAAALLFLAAQAAALELPRGAMRAAESAEALGSYAVPRGAWREGGLPALVLEGRVEMAAWQIPTSATTLQLLAPLRDQLEQEGFEIVFECWTEACGGFDFRYGLRLLPEPEMHVNLADFRYLAALRPGTAGAEGMVLVVSRTAERGYVHITHVDPAAGERAPAGPVPPPDPDAGGAAPPPAAAGGVPAGAPPQAAPATGSLAVQLETAGRAVLGDLAFETGSSRLSAGPFASLAELAAYLAANPARRITLVGHTDASGALEPNIALSRARARAVRERLIAEHGADPARISADGVGFLMPLASNLTEEGRAANRRVEAVVTSTE
ncbi:MAG: OmpA family protein [Rhodobacteraceae bacterium]|nr:OmpA family protein [Paracoccaceae bacterium]